MIFAVGTPGQKLRMYFEGKSREQAEASIENGEVLIDLQEKGAYTDIISADGKTLSPYQMTPTDLADAAHRAFQETRRRAYPSTEDQLDMIYHAGLDAWRSEIGKIKAANPKP